MANFGWFYPPGFDLRLLDEPDECEHNVHMNDECRKCEGNWDYEGCEHGRPYPRIYYNEDGEPAEQPTEEYEYDDESPNPNCEDCLAETKHNASRSRNTRAKEMQPI